MDEQLKTLRRAFNKLGSRWIIADETAAYIHGKQLDVPVKKPRYIYVMIKKYNYKKFFETIVGLGYEYNALKSYVRKYRFEKRGNIPIYLLLTDDSINSVVYNSIPLQKIGTLGNKRLEARRKLLDNVVGHLMRNNNVN